MDLSEVNMLHIETVWQTQDRLKLEILARTPKAGTVEHIFNKVNSGITI